MSMSNRLQQVRRVLVLVLIANLMVAAAKLVVGALSGSLAILADGFHSVLDATSNVVGLIGVAIASQPPDTDHPYGHRRFETLASMLIGGMLLLTAWELVQGVIRQLSAGVSPEVTALSFGVMVVTIVCNIAVTRYERIMSQRIGSELLAADAEHTRSDVLVSLSVIIGLIAVSLGLPWADAVVALFVVILLGVAAWRIVGSAASILVDQAALDEEPVRELVNRVPGIDQVLRVRSRGPVDDIHLDLDIQVPAPMTARQADSIGREVRTQVRDAFAGVSDIQIAFAPSQKTNDDHALIARAEADALGLDVHEVISATTDRGLTLELHVEVPADQNVGEAHETVTCFETRMYDAIDDLVRIVTHIEPAHSHEKISMMAADGVYLADAASKIAFMLYPDWQWHDLDIRREKDGGYAVSMHAHLPTTMTIAEAHRIAERVETAIRAAHPIIHRVTIHTEPSDTE